MKKTIFYCDRCNTELTSVMRHIHISTHYIGEESSADKDHRTNIGFDFCYACEDAIFKPKNPTFTHSVPAGTSGTIYPHQGVNHREALLENATGYGLGSPVPITIKEDTNHE